MSLSINYDISRAKQKIAEAKRIARGDGGRLRPAWQAAGQSLLGNVRTAFRTKARGGTDESGIAWPKNSWITLLLREGWSGGKARSWSDFTQRRASIGQDTGSLFQSLTPGQPGNIFDTGNQHVTIGSNWATARRFQYGGTLPVFRMTQEMYRRARDRVAKPRRLTKAQRSKVARGRDPGDAQRDLRQFNRSVFGILFGMQAKQSTPTQPERLILPDRSRVPQPWIKAASEVFQTAFKTILKGLGS